MPATERLALGSIGVGLVVLALKLAAWLLTGSAALFSDAAETVVNVAAGVITLAAIRFAARPADANHPYGHEKAELFAAVIEGALIVVAALVILREAWLAFWHPAPLEQPVLGVAVNLVATALNASWAAILLRHGKRHRSVALVADARHLFSDVATSAGVAIGFALLVITGETWVDAAVAALTAVYVLVAGMRVINDSVGGLMDAAPPPDVVARIRDVVSRHADGAIEAHDLRMRPAGRHTFLEFHLVVPGQMTVAEAHAICDRIEAALAREMDGVRATIHVEPEGKAKHQGVLVL